MSISTSVRTSAMALAALVLSASTVAAQGASQAAPRQRPAPASPRDSVVTTIAGANINVNYGRPSLRGRKVFGALNDMKWGTVWRTGANEATHFTTSKALKFGNVEVPAGTYTLFTKIEEKGDWELIVNSQTKQWGTAYDGTKDLVRIPLKVTRDNPVTETMLITVTPAGNGGEMTIAWDTYKATTRFTAK